MLTTSSYRWCRQSIRIANLLAPISLQIMEQLLQIDVYINAINIFTDMMMMLVILLNGAQMLILSNIFDRRSVGSVKTFETGN